MNHGTTEHLRRVTDAGKKISTGVILRGNYDASDVALLRSRIPFTGSLALESMQVEEARQAQALRNLIVVKPRQSGLAQTAAMTAMAINDPTNTSVVVLHPDNPTPEETVDLDNLVRVLHDEGAEVFESFERVVEQLGEAALESESFVLYQAL